MQTIVTMMTTINVTHPTAIPMISFGSVLWFDDPEPESEPEGETPDDEPLDGTGIGVLSGRTGQIEDIFWTSRPKNVVCV